MGPALAHCRVVGSDLIGIDRSLGPLCLFIAPPRSFTKWAAAFLDALHTSSSWGGHTTIEPFAATSSPKQVVCLRGRSPMPRTYGASGIAALRGADCSKNARSYDPPQFVAVLRPYVLDFFNRGIAEIECRSCRGIVRDVEMTTLNERREGTQVSWTGDWRCGSGHPLYWENHEVRFCM